MKTSSKIFAVLFGLLFLVTTSAALCGYTHQWVMAAASGIMTVALLIDVYGKKDPKINNKHPFSHGH